MANIWEINYYIEKRTDAQIFMKGETETIGFKIIDRNAVPDSGNLSDGDKWYYSESYSTCHVNSFSLPFISLLCRDEAPVLFDVKFWKYGFCNSRVSNLASAVLPNTQTPKT